MAEGRENQLATAVLDGAFHVHTRLGPGLLESVYETVLAHELRKSGIEVKTQVPLAIRYDGLTLEAGFRADLVVEESLIVEIKSVEKLAPVHAKQLLTYLRLTDRRLGLLLNFGQEHLKDGVKRVANGL